MHGFSNLSGLSLWNKTYGTITVALVLDWLSSMSGMFILSAADISSATANGLATFTRTGKFLSRSSADEPPQADGTLAASPASALLNASNLSAGSSTVGPGAVAAQQPDAASPEAPNFPCHSTGKLKALETGAAATQAAEA